MDNYKTLENIRDVFSIFHDGTIESWIGNQKLLKLKINCEYLAQKIDKIYKVFYVEFEDLEKLELVPWLNPINKTQILLNNIEDIFRANLEILSAEIENEIVKITCNQINTNYDYFGGTLFVSCKKVKVFDEKNNELTIEILDEICNDYWNEIKVETEKKHLKN